MRRSARLAVLTLAAGTLVATAGAMAATAPAALAASGPVYTVMNTNNPPPDGVWFRNSPHTADTNRITGDGVYMNDSVRLICYAFGDAVGPYNDTLWYDVTNLTRPTVPSTGAPNTGYLNAHYINDGKAAGQVDAGVPQCGAAPPPPQTAPPPPPTAQYQYLWPDDAMWCADNPPFGTQVRELGWVVTFEHATTGDTTANSDKCDYTVDLQIPSGTGDDNSDTFETLIPNYYTNMNWASACAQQFPGSTLVWVYFVPNPWQCKAPAGRYYPPPSG